MKTVTLRLTDTEAEALDRMAYICGKSKKEFLVYLLSCESDNFNYFREITRPAFCNIPLPHANAAYLLNMCIYFCFCVEEAGECGLDVSVKEALDRIKKVYEYSLKHAANVEEAEKITQTYRKFLEDERAQPYLAQAEK